MPEHVLALCVGFVMDALFGDPHFLWHPVQGIGKLIEWMEKQLFSLFHLSSEREMDKGRKRAAGVILDFYGDYHIAFAGSGQNSSMVKIWVGKYYLLSDACHEISADRKHEGL